MLCRRNCRGVSSVMKMQLSCALTVIMTFTAKAAIPKVMMNGNFSITGMCLSHQKSEIVNQNYIVCIFIMHTSVHCYIFILQQYLYRSSDK